MRKAVFLDRDGVINKLIKREDKSYSPKSPIEVSIFEGVIDSIKLIKKV